MSFLKWFHILCICIPLCHTTVYLLFVFTCTETQQVVTVTPVNSTTVTVSWSEVQCFNGSGTVTHYLVQYWSSCGGAVKNVTTNSLVQNVSGLEPNIAVYIFQVAAVGSGQKMELLSNPVNASLRAHSMWRRLISYPDPSLSCEKKNKQKKTV